MLITGVGARIAQLHTLRSDWSGGEGGGQEVEGMSQRAEWSPGSVLYCWTCCCCPYDTLEGLVWLLETERCLGLHQSIALHKATYRLALKSAEPFISTDVCLQPVDNVERKTVLKRNSV